MSAWLGSCSKVEVSRDAWSRVEESSVNCFRVSMMVSAWLVSCRRVDVRGEWAGSDRGRSRCVVVEEAMLM